MLLKGKIVLGGSYQRGTSVNLNQPTFEVFIYKNIIPIKLEAVSVVNDDILNSFQRTQVNLINILLELGKFSLPINPLEIAEERLKGPFTSVNLIVFRGILLK